jgi:uncharacterized RDD family membrane protein YckC
METQAPPPPGPGGPSGPRASFGRRLVAALLDGIVLAIPNSILNAVLGRYGGGAISLALAIAYFGYLEGSPSGQTVGKRALGIRVVDFNTGGPIGFGRAVVRFVGRYVSFIACFLGYLWMLWDKEKQTWHDKFASDVVVPQADYPVASWPG